MPKPHWMSALCLASLSAVTLLTEQIVKAGYILRPDADATIAAAQHTAIGKR
jgi:hypothetical protein